MPKIKITELELKKIIQEEVLKSLPKDVRIIESQYDEEDFPMVNEYNERYGKQLSEGLIKTYPIDMTIDILKRKFFDKEIDFDVKKTENITIIPRLIIMIPKSFTKNEIGTIMQIMKTCGYFSYKENEIKGDKIYLYFEPKYTTDITNYVNGSLFHLTDTVYLDKIKKYGLVPRSKNSSFKYPDRIYLMPRLDDRTQHQLSKIKNARERAKQNSDYHNPSDESKYIILKIDSTKIPNNVRFYADPMSRGIFTYGNIPPSAIVAMRTFLN